MLKTETKLKYTNILRAEYSTERNDMAGSAIWRNIRYLMEWYLKDKDFKVNTLE